MTDNNLGEVTIENESFKRPDVLNMNDDISFMENLTSFSKKQLVNRLNKIII